MEDHKLKVFCTVAETKSFSKTSEIIHLTQPAVSLQIQALEEIYETKLFDRSSSTVTLTPAGEILYKYAKEILSLYASAEKVIGELTGLVKGSISIGASSTIGNYLLARRHYRFQKSSSEDKGPSSRWQYQEGGRTSEFGQYRPRPCRRRCYQAEDGRGETDPGRTPSVVPSYHPWAKKKDISIAELYEGAFYFQGRRVQAQGR